MRYFLSIFFYLSSMVLVYLDKTFTYRWWGFGLHSISILIIVVYFIRNTISFKSIKKELWVGVLVIITIVVSFWALQSYPWVSVGDEVRDCGLDARSIALGVRLNIFEYGFYDGYGLIIPTLASFFWRIFGNTVWTYRVPSALIAILDVMILAIFLRMWLGKLPALLGGLILLSLPLHLYFGRTMPVVAFNSFWMSCFLLGLYILWQKQRLIDYIFLGTMLGLAARFHAGIRSVAILILLIVLALGLKKRLYLNIFYILLFCLVGFSPQLLFSNQTNFFHTSRLLENLNLNLLAQNYWRSLGVWIYQPTWFFYADRQPLLSLGVAVLFLVGILVIIKSKNKFGFILIFLALVVPFFNSAITDIINGDHRVNPLLPIGAALAVVGINQIIKGRILISLLVVIICFWQIGAFFYFQPANKNFTTKDYLSMKIVDYLKENQETGEVRIEVSAVNFENLNLLHYKEQYWYFVPELTVSLYINEDLPDDIAIVNSKVIKYP